MAEKDYRTSGEIIIHVKGDPDAVKKPKRRAPSPPAKPVEGILTRRTRPAGIKFYDMGQIKDGEGWKDNPINARPHITFEIIGGANAKFTFNDFTLDHWQDWQFHLLSLGGEPAQWKNNFRPIDDERWGVAIWPGTGPGILANSTDIDPITTLRAGVNPYWDAGTKTYKSPSANLQIFAGTGGLGINFNTFDTTNYKITETFDYAAPGVAVDFRQSLNVFLLPRPLFTQMFNESGVDAGFWREGLYQQYVVKSRELFLDKTMKRSAPFTGDNQSIPIFEGYFLSEGVGSNGIKSDDGTWLHPADQRWITDAFRNELVASVKRDVFFEGQYWNSDNMARLAQEGTVAAGPPYPIFYEQPPIADFPHLFAGHHIKFGAHYYGDHLTGTGWGVAPIDSDTYIGPGILAAVIQNGSQWFYIWTAGAENLGYWPNIQLAGIPD